MKISTKLKFKNILWASEGYGKKIKFDIIDFQIVNNAAGILLEQVGSDGIQYNLKNLVFQDNHFKGNDNSMGLIHFDFANIAKNSNISVGTVTFIRNYAGANPVGLSVSGTGNQSLNVETIYQSDLSETFCLINISTIEFHQL